MKKLLIMLLAVTTMLSATTTNQIYANGGVLNVSSKVVLGKSISKPTITFNDETVTEVYSLNFEDRQYHKVTDYEVMKEITSKITKYDPKSTKTLYQNGFLIVTDGNKYEYNLIEDGANAKEKELINLSKKCNEDYDGNIQWLSFMSSSNITKIHAISPYFDKPVAAAPSQEDIRAMSNFLKSLTVNSEIKLSEDEVNPQDPRAHISLKFKSGVEYIIHLTDFENVYISSSHAEGEIMYTLQLSKDVEVALTALGKQLA